MVIKEPKRSTDVRNGKEPENCKTMFKECRTTRDSEDRESIVYENKKVRIKKTSTGIR